MHPFHELQKLGQSIWLDYIDRKILRSGDLAGLIADGSVRGVTSNPAIFEKAISTDSAYAEDLRLHGDTTTAPGALFEYLAIPDIRETADLLLPVYRKSARRDGYVSLEVSPTLAYDTAGTVAEARRLWDAVGRDNLMIKVPATEQGLPAITQLIARGINVNATLLFADAMYRRTVDAWLDGLEQWVASGGDAGRVASVASFFISRIDASIDPLLQTIGTPQAAALQGKIAIANARLAYHHYQQMLASPRWLKLAAQGAQSQRLLWASTGVKNPIYRDVMYIEELIGADTVNTVPPATLVAFREHGQVRASLNTDMAAAEQQLAQLAAQNILLDDITAQLLKQGVDVFAAAYEKLLQAIVQQARQASGAHTS